MHAASPQMRVLEYVRPTEFYSFYAIADKLFSDYWSAASLATEHDNLTGDAATIKKIDETAPSKYT